MFDEPAKTVSHECSTDNGMSANADATHDATLISGDYVHSFTRRQRIQEASIKGALIGSVLFGIELDIHNIRSIMIFCTGVVSVCSLFCFWTWIVAKNEKYLFTDETFTWEQNGKLKLVIPWEDILRPGAGKFCLLTKRGVLYPPFSTFDDASLMREIIRQRSKWISDQRCMK